MSREQDELELSSEMRQATVELGERFAGCPEPALLLAAQEGVLPPGISAAVVHHLGNCPLCKVIVGDFEEVTATPLSHSDRIGIWNRIQPEQISAPASASVVAVHGGLFGQVLRRWAIAIAATAILVIGIAILIKMNRGPNPQEQVATQRVPEAASEQPPNPATPAPQATLASPATPVSPATPDSATPFRLEKAPVSLPAEAVMVWRGESAAGDPQMAELKEALAPYRADNYAEAERRLQNLCLKHPHLAEARFYLGVSQLFLDRNQDAVQSLKTARSLGPHRLVREVDWYLALAFHRTGQDGEARPLVEKLCDAGGKDSARACAARTELSNSLKN